LNIYYEQLETKINNNIGSRGSGYVDIVEQKTKAFLNYGVSYVCQAISNGFSYIEKKWCDYKT